MAEKQTHKERIKEITAGIEQGIKDLFESDKYQKYLTTMSRFHRYSLNNIMLIHSQRPDATLVAGFNKWKNQFGRHVRKGEKGIDILAPTPYKIKVEKEKLDPDTKLPILDAYGNAIIEEKEISIPMFKVVKVFDVSQTDGKPLPQLAMSLNGDVAQYELFMEALRRTSPVPIDIQPIQQDTDGFLNLETQKITLREGMSQVQTICACVHEIAHAKLHNYKHMTVTADDGTALAPEEKDRHTEEVEAESISYAVCQYFGIETGENSFGYIATWSQGKELKELRESLETINKTSSDLITSIEHHFAELTKEREAERNPAEAPDLHPVEEIQPSAQENIDPHITIAEMNAFGYTEPEMYPVCADFALELMERDVPIYMLHSDNTEAMVFDSEDIAKHVGLLGVEKADWDLVKDAPAILALQEQFRVSYRQERGFQERMDNTYGIYQLKREDSTTDLRFMNYSYLEKKGLTPQLDNYDLVYSRALSPAESQGQTLEQLYTTFNINRPEDFIGHSLSVSDVVVLNQNGKTSCHYVDSVGFKEIPGFLKQENYLKSAEIQLEDDLGMIDGIINNGKAPTQEDETRKKKPSIRDQLKAKNDQPRQKKPNKKSKEEISL